MMNTSITFIKINNPIIVKVKDSLVSRFRMHFIGIYLYFLTSDLTIEVKNNNIVLAIEMV